MLFTILMPDVLSLRLRTRILRVRQKSAESAEGCAFVLHALPGKLGAADLKGQRRVSPTPRGLHAHGLLQG